MTYLPHNQLSPSITHLKLGHTEDALANAMRAVELRPSWGMGHFCLGSALRAEGKLELAAKALLKCLSFDPDNAAAACELRELMPFKDCTLRDEADPSDFKDISCENISEKVEGSATERPQVEQRVKVEAGASSGGSLSKALESDHDAAVDTSFYDKKKAHSSGTECANCGIMGSSFNACSRCKVVHYCNKACQSQHWKATGGHKRFCVPKEDRKMPAAGGARAIGSAESSSECAICLDYVTAPTSSVLPCSHTFHIKCVEELRAFGVAQACPMCRAKLPPGPEKLFDEATRRYFKFKKQTGERWEALSIAQQKEIDEITSIWGMAAKQGHASSSCNLGYVLEAKGELVEAEAAYRRALEIKPMHAKASCNLGNVLEAKGDLVGAEAAFRKAIKIDPTHFKASYKLGNVLKGKGELVEAEAAYRRALEINPMFTEASCNLGYILNIKGNITGAEAAYRRALEIDPTNAKASCYLGNILVNKGDFVGAEAAYRTSLESNPKFADASFNLGVALRAKGDLSGAETAYRRALEINPMHGKASCNLGNALHAKGNIAGAEAAYRRALEIDTMHTDASCNLGVVLEAKGDLAGAEAAYRRALEIDPKHTKSSCNLGVILEAKRNVAGTESADCRADASCNLSSSPKAKGGDLEIDLDDSCNLGSTLKAKGNQVGAEVAVVNSRALGIDSARNGLSLSSGNALKSRVAIAGGTEVAYCRALNIDPAHARAYCDLGAMLEAKGDREGAKAAFRRAFLMNPATAPP